MKQKVIVLGFIGLLILFCNASKEETAKANEQEVLRKKLDQVRAIVLYISDAKFVEDAKGDHNYHNMKGEIYQLNFKWNFTIDAVEPRQVISAWLIDELIEEFAEDVEKLKNSEFVPSLIKEKLNKEIEKIQKINEIKFEVETSPTEKNEMDETTEVEINTSELDKKNKTTKFKVKNADVQSKKDKNTNKWYIICAIAFFLVGLCYCVGWNTADEEMLQDVDDPTHHFPSETDLVLDVKEIIPDDHISIEYSPSTTDFELEVKEMTSEESTDSLSVKHSNTSGSATDALFKVEIPSSDLHEENKSEVISALSISEMTEEIQTVQSMKSKSASSEQLTSQFPTKKQKKEKNSQI